MNKIIFISSFPLYQNEAPSIQVIELSRSFIKLGYNTTVVTPGITKLKNNYDIKIKYIPATKKLISLFYEPLSTLYIIYKILTDRPNIIYYTLSPLIIFPVLVSKLFRIPTISIVNGIQEEEIQLLGGPILKLLGKIGFFKRIESLNYLLSDHIIVVTNGIKKYIIKQFDLSQNKISTIYNGVDISIFKPLIKNDTFLIPNYSSKYIYIGYVGGIMKWQGINYMLNAVEKIIHTNENIRLIIVGDGEQKKTLELYVKKLGLSKYIIFLGSVQNTVVPQLLSLFDICLSYHTKIRDGITSPFKIFEYLACGKATIISNLSEVKDLFGNVTIVANAEDDNDLSNKMLYLINNPNIRKILSNKAREFIEIDHSWNQVAIKYLEIVSKK